MAGSDDDCLADVFGFEPEGYNDRVDVHAHKHASDIHACVGAGVDVFDDYGVLKIVIMSDCKGSACMVLRDHIYLFKAIAVHYFAAYHQCAVQVFAALYGHGYSPVLQGI